MSRVSQVERLVAENVPEAIWLRLKRLTSSSLCRKSIEKNHPTLSPEISDKKASGMSWAVRSALGYWETSSGGLNSKILSRYYGLLQFSMAEQIASGNPDDDLTTIQRHTEFGHGLFTLSDTEKSFPTAYFIGCLKSGHYHEYCKHLGVDLSPFTFDRRPRSFSDVNDHERSKLLSLEELLLRVPELQAVTGEYLDKKPLSFHVGHATRNLQLKAEQERARISNPFSKVEEIPKPLENGGQETTYISIYPHEYNYSLKEMNSFNFPIQNIEIERDQFSGIDHFTGTFIHPNKGYWWQYMNTYKSGYCGTSLILPFWKTTDPFLLHLTILYGFSIVVRYLPNLWHRIEDGDLDHIRALLEHYLVIVDNVLPKLIVERLTGIHLAIVQPGSLSAPV